MANSVTKLRILCKNIKHARKQKGFTQNELAEKLDISREHLAKVETAKRCASLTLLFKICEILEIEEKDLFNFKKS